MVNEKGNCVSEEKGKRKRRKRNWSVIATVVGQKKTMRWNVNGKERKNFVIS